MKRLAWTMALAVAVAGCATKEPAPKPDLFAATRDPSCYTVDLFFDWKVAPPAAEVPEAWRAFAGVWGEGKWAGQWCHDLYVLNITPSGEATVIETHAPLAAWGKPASAFRRTAKIGEDGRLRLAYGKVRVEYWIEGDTLYGLKNEGKGGGDLVIALRRKPITQRARA